MAGNNRRRGKRIDWAIVILALALAAVARRSAVAPAVWVVLGAAAVGAVAIGVHRFHRLRSTRPMSWETAESQTPSTDQASFTDHQDPQLAAQIAQLSGSGTPLGVAAFPPPTATPIPVQRRRPAPAAAAPTPSRPAAPGSEIDMSDAVTRMRPGSDISFDDLGLATPQPGPRQRPGGTARSSSGRPVRPATTSSVPAEVVGSSATDRSLASPSILGSSLTASSLLQPTSSLLSSSLEPPEETGSDRRSAGR